MSLTKQQQALVKTLNQHATQSLSVLVNSNLISRTFSSEFMLRDWLYGIYQDILNKKIVNNISKEVTFPNSMSFPVNESGTVTQTRSVDLLIQKTSFVNGKSEFTGLELLKYLGLDNVKNSKYNQVKDHLDKIVDVKKNYTAIDMVDLKHTKYFRGRVSPRGTVTITDFCTMLNRNYFDGLLNHTKKYRTAGTAYQNFKGPRGWINKLIKPKRISSDIKLARLILVAEQVNSYIYDLAESFNNQNHVLYRENGQAIFKKVEVMTLGDYLQYMESQPWFQLRQGALDELKYKFLTSTQKI